MNLWNLLRGLLVFATAFLVSCAGGDKEMEELIPEGARTVDLNSSDKYNWMKDVQMGKDGSITGGKRSMYDNAGSAGYRGRVKTPEYLKKDYYQKEWNGSKNYAAGSYDGKMGARESGTNSRFGGQQAHGSGQEAWMAGKNYAAGTYQTGNARERSRDEVERSGVAVVEHRERVWGWNPTIYSKDEYRKMTMQETRSLLGKE
ncbi:MAG: hypothetical protein ACQKBY_11455 [Verrucomicrobiales bacterium]